MQMIRHIIILNWRKDVTQQQIDNWRQTLDRMPDECPMLYNWYSGPSTAGPDPNNHVTHDFLISMDLRSLEEFGEFDEVPYHKSIYNEAMKVVDMTSIVNMNVLVEAEPLRTNKKSVVTQTE